MTEYDVHQMYEEQIAKNKVTALHANNGVLTVHFADGTIEIWKKNWRGKLKRRVKRDRSKK